MVLKQFHLHREENYFLLKIYSNITRFHFLFFYINLFQFFIDKNDMFEQSKNIRILFIRRWIAYFVVGYNELKRVNMLIKHFLFIQRS